MTEGRKRKRTEKKKQGERETATKQQEKYGSTDEQKKSGQHLSYDVFPPQK